MTEDDMRLWERVCATVRKLGEKVAPSAPPPFVAPLPDGERNYIDLHGLTVDEAYRATVEFLEDTNLKVVLIITGKSGQIRQEFPHWMEVLGYRYIMVNGDGAFRINTKRVSRTTR